MQLMFDRLLLTVVIWIGTVQAVAADRPNILWLSFEDTSPYELATYGNAHTRTPTMDRLAAEGIRFDRASSVAPHCSAARATIISGCFATTWGTDIHRQPWPVPHRRYYFPRLLREAGYFTTNNAKTDYNAKGMESHLSQVWDQQGNNATYLAPERQGNQPFFAVFNSNKTHMSRIRSFHLEDRRNFAEEDLDPANLKLPPYVPDTPEIRSDYAMHLEGVNDVDRWVTLHLDILKEHGLDDDTIVFVFSDHGGCLPRGKGYPFETGLQAVFLVYVPERFQHLCHIPSGIPSQRLVGFEDLAPTVLELAAVEVPEHYQGTNLLGKRDKPYQFGFRTNHENHFDPVRTVSDGRFKYIRNYIPHRPLGLWQNYQWGCPGHFAWYRLAVQREVKRSHAEFLAPKPNEMLFDLSIDPWEQNNLADNPSFAEQLRTLGEALDEHLELTRDLGFFPRSQRSQRQATPLVEVVQNTHFPLTELHALAKLASQGDSSNTAVLLEHAYHSRPEFRFWAAAGLATLAQRDKLSSNDPTIEALEHLLKDECVEAAAEAACALAYLGESERCGDWILEKLSPPGSDRSVVSSAFEVMSPYLEDQRAKLKPLSKREPAKAAFLRAGWISFDDFQWKNNQMQEGLRVNRRRAPLEPLP